MGRDYSPKIRQRADLERKRAAKPLHDRVLVVCEGRKTEPGYFSEIRSTYRLSTARVEILPCALGTAPLQVVKYARQLVEEGNIHRRMAARAVEQVYVVFDRDEHASFREAYELACSLDGTLRNDERQPIVFRPIVSVPCFELWFLLHFADINRSLHRRDIQNLLLRHMPDYQKAAENIFERTKGKLAIAHQRARELLGKNTPFDGSPYTNVSELVKLLAELGQ